MNIVLIGYRGCGKTSVGRLLANQLGWPFLDTDRLIEEGTGQTIRSIFADGRGEAFRDLETEVVLRIAQLDRHIISTGGGTLLRDVNARILKQTSRLVWLTAPAEILHERILGDIQRLKTRPVVDAHNGQCEIRSELAERESIYARWADCIIDTSGQSTDDLVKILRDHLAI